MEITTGRFGTLLGSYDINFYPMPKSHVLDKTIFYLGEGNGILNTPQDLFIDENDNLYIADTGNNRVLRFDKEGTVTGIFDNKEEKGFKNPGSVFADKYGAVYVADTDNNRIVKLSKDGAFVEEFTAPVSDVLPDDFIFNPRKISVSPTGYIYAIKHQYLMNIDAMNSFRGYIGTSFVGFDLNYALTKMFANDKQKIAMKKREPVSINSFDMMDNGIVYITTVDGLLRKINSVGNNIYPKATPFGVSTLTEDRKTIKQPSFKDLAVSKSEIIYMLEEWSGEIYVYDSTGENLTNFGYIGDGKDSWKMPVAIEVDSTNKVYVLDAEKNCVQVFKPTEFMQTVITAVEYYDKGDYGKDIEFWRLASESSENYRLSNKGIARSLMKQGKYEESMDFYLVARDKLGYSKAFKKYRYEFFKENFLLVIILGLVVIVGGFFLLIRLNKFIENEMKKYRHII